jgi:hypothetical protein
MVSVGKLLERGIIYELIAFILVYLITKYWFGKSREQTLRYTIVVFVALAAYYTIFHYVILNIIHE